MGFSSSGSVKNIIMDSAHVTPRVLSGLKSTGRGTTRGNNLLSTHQSTSSNVSLKTYIPPPIRMSVQRLTS